MNHLSEKLKDLGLWMKPVARDGSCLYRCVADKVYNSQLKHIYVRKLSCKLMTEHPTLFKTDMSLDELIKHAFMMMNSNIPGALLEINALSLIFGLDFEIFPSEYPCEPFQVKAVSHCKTKIQVARIDLVHFNIITNKSNQEKEALIQSILYESLYEKVFGLKDTLRKSNEMILKKKIAKEKFHSERNDSSGDALKMFKSITSLSNFEDSATDTLMSNSSLNCREFSLKVARSISDKEYRNVSLDIWFDERKDFSNWPTYEIGEKVSVRRPYGSEYGFIQELSENHGKITIYLNDAGERVKVDMKDIIMDDNQIKEIGSSISNKDWEITQSDKIQGNKISRVQKNKSTIACKSFAALKKIQPVTQLTPNTSVKPVQTLPSSSIEPSESSIEIPDVESTSYIRPSTSTSAAVQQPAPTATLTPPPPPPLLQIPLTPLPRLAQIPEAPEIPTSTSTSPRFNIPPPDAVYRNQFQQFQQNQQVANAPSIFSMPFYPHQAAAASQQQAILLSYPQVGYANPLSPNDVMITSAMASAARTSPFNRVPAAAQARHAYPSFQNPGGPQQQQPHPYSVNTAHIFFPANGASVTLQIPLAAMNIIHEQQQILQDRFNAEASQAPVASETVESELVYPDSYHVMYYYQVGIQQYFYNTMMERHLVESREAGIDISTLPPPVNPTAVFRHIDENVLPAPPCRGVRIHVPGDPIGMWVRAVPTEPRPQFDNTQRLHHLPENASLMYTETYQQRENRLQRETRTSAPNTQNDVDVEAAGLTPTADVADSAPVEAPVDAPVETPASSSSTSSPASMTAEQLAELRTSTGVDFIRVEQLGHGETVVINNKVMIYRSKTLLLVMDENDRTKDLGAVPMPLNDLINGPYDFEGSRARSDEEMVILACANASYNAVHISKLISNGLLVQKYQEQSETPRESIGQPIQPTQQVPPGQSQLNVNEQGQQYIPTHINQFIPGPGQQFITSNQPIIPITNNWFDVAYRQVYGHLQNYLQANAPVNGIAPGLQSLGFTGEPKFTYPRMQNQPNVSNTVHNVQPVVSAHNNDQPTTQTHRSQTAASTNLGQTAASTNLGQAVASTNLGQTAASTNLGQTAASTNLGQTTASTNLGQTAASTNLGQAVASTNLGQTIAGTNLGQTVASTNLGQTETSTNLGQTETSTNLGQTAASTNLGQTAASTNLGQRVASTNLGQKVASTNPGQTEASTNVSQTTPTTTQAIIPTLQSLIITPTLQTIAASSQNQAFVSSVQQLQGLRSSSQYNSQGWNIERGHTNRTGYRLRNRGMNHSQGRFYGQPQYRNHNEGRSTGSSRVDEMDAYSPQRFPRQARGHRNSGNRSHHRYNRY